MREVDEWLDEQEVFSSRRERVPADALPWIEEAAKVGWNAALEEAALKFPTIGGYQVIGQILRDMKRV